MHSHCSRTQLPGRTTTRSCRLNDSGLFNIYFQSRQWICFLRMQDGLISKSAWINTRNIRRGRFAFVDIGNGRGWGNPPCTTKPTTCAQRSRGSAWASTQSDQSLRCPHEESLGPWLPFERTAKTDQNPSPMEAVLKNDVHYVLVLVVCNPDPLGQGT